MYEEGYSLVNMQNNHLYVIPGGGYDYLNNEELFTEWAPNKFYDYNTEETIPSYSPQMLGAAYMIWNDMSGNLDLGICEYDLYDRFEQSLAVLGAKLWGMENVLGKGEAYEEFTWLEEQVQEGMRDSKGKRNRVYDEKIGIEPSYKVRMRVYLEENQADGQDKDSGRPDTVSEEPADKGEMEQIIAKSDSPYGVWAFYAAMPGTGRVGFAREGKTYTWDCVLPRGKWVELEVVGELGQTSLYADGKLVGTLGSGEPFEEHATFVFPVQRIGEETGAFRGKVEMLEVK